MILQIDTVLLYNNLLARSFLTEGQPQAIAYIAYKMCTVPLRGEASTECLAPYSSSFLVYHIGPLTSQQGKACKAAPSTCLAPFTFRKASE